MRIYSIRDNDIGSYNKPFYSITEVEALRAVASGIKNTMLEEFPASFSLYEMGVFDEATGRFKQDEDHPKSIMPVQQILNNRQTTSKDMREAIIPKEEIKNEIRKS